jgi:hypothetical protein
MVNLMVNCCFSDLEEAEDQYQMSLRTQLVNIDGLIKLHDSRLYSLERSFQEELRQSQADFEREKALMVSRFRHEKKELSAILDAIELEEEGRDNEVSLSLCVCVPIPPLPSLPLYSLPTPFPPYSHFLL